MPQPPPVEGFYYLDPDSDRHGEICQILDRWPPDPLAYLPTFLVRFDDGVEALAVSHSLHPWYGLADEDVG